MGRWVGGWVGGGRDVPRICWMKIWAPVPRARKSGRRQLIMMLGEVGGWVGERRGAGGWIGGWVGDRKVEEDEAVRMSDCELERGGGGGG